jgi:dihydropteroate synthase
LLVSIENDVSALRLDPRIAEVIAATRAGAMLMHSRGTVSEMGTYAHATYGEDVVGEIEGELCDAVARARGAGIADDSIVLDPGIGFAKRHEHSLAALAGIPRLAALGFPILVGVSRKRFIGEITGVKNPAERTHGTVGANVAALFFGARLFRVHDVRPNREALDVAWAVMKSAGPDARFPIPDSRP